MRKSDLLSVRFGGMKGESRFRKVWDDGGERRGDRLYWDMSYGQVFRSSYTMTSLQQTVKSNGSSVLSMLIQQISCQLSKHLTR
jgi:hypothetical protein